MAMTGMLKIISCDDAFFIVMLHETRRSHCPNILEIQVGEVADEEATVDWAAASPTGSVAYH